MAKVVKCLLCGHGPTMKHKKAKNEQIDLQVEDESADNKSTGKANKPAPKTLTLALAQRYTKGKKIMNTFKKYAKRFLILVVASYVFTACPGLVTGTASGVLTASRAISTTITAVTLSASAVGASKAKKAHASNFGSESL